MRLKNRFLLHLCTALSAALLLSGCTEAISFGVGFGAGFFTGMQYQKSQIKDENSVYMGSGSSDAAMNSGSMSGGAYPNTGGSMDYYASGIPSAPADPYGGTYPAPAPVYSAPLPGSQSPAVAPPPLASQMNTPAPAPMAPPPYMPPPTAMAPPPAGYGMAPPVQTYGGSGYYAPAPAPAPTQTPFGMQGQLRPSAYGYAASPPSTYGW